MSLRLVTVVLASICAFALLAGCGDIEVALDPDAGCGAASCDDDNPCTEDRCADDGTCRFEPTNEGGACDDGDPSTEGDICAAGVCAGVPAACLSDADCLILGDACTVGVCTDAGVCEPRPAPDGAACDDFDPCTVRDACAGGVCEPGPPLACFDDEPCTDDICVPGEGCVHPPAPVGTECDDFDPCTVADACLDGVCGGVWTPDTCACTTDFDCEEDDNPCTTVHCGPSGECEMVFDEECCSSDGDCFVDDECLVAWCDRETNRCAYETAPGCCSSDWDCDDGDPCTDDVCAEDGRCVALPNPLCCGSDGDCDDGDPCTADVCEAGECVVGAWLCCQGDEDCLGEPCLVGLCLEGGCAFVPAPLGSPCEARGLRSGEPTVGVCGGDAVCEPVRRGLYPAEAPDTTQGGFALHAVHRAGRDDAVWAVGSLEEYGTKFGAVFRLGDEDAALGIVHQSETIGAFADVSSNLAVGTAGVALLLREPGEWVKPELRLTGDIPPGVTVDSLRDSFRGAFGFSGVGSAGEASWLLSREEGGIYGCGELDAQLVCSPHRLSSHTPTSLGGGPVWGYRDSVRGTLGAWYASNGGSYAAAILALPPTDEPSQAEWTAESPLGCMPSEAEEVCGVVRQWNDVHGGVRGGEAVTWAVGDAGALAYRAGAQEGWERVELPPELFGDTTSRPKQEDFNWTGVFALPDQVFLVGNTDAPLDGGEPRAGASQRTLVLVHYVPASSDVPEPSAHLVVLDEKRSLVTFPPEPPASAASVNGIWGAVEGGRLRLWIVGAWPEYQDGRADDVRALAYTVEFSLTGQGPDLPL